MSQSDGAVRLAAPSGRLSRSGYLFAGEALPASLSSGGHDVGEGDVFASYGRSDGLAVLDADHRAVDQPAMVVVVSVVRLG